MATLQTLQKKVLIVGVDGCRPDALQAARTPNLDSLIFRGASSFETATCEVLLSGPGWSSVLTGVSCDKHGVYDNSFSASRFDVYPHFFQRLKELRPDAYTMSIVNWAPINTQILSGCDWSASLDSDAMVAASAAVALSNGDPDVVFVHFDEVDAAGHAYGFAPDCAEYLDAINEVDTHIGLLVDAIGKRRTAPFEDWLTIVTTDHGGSGKQHSQNSSANETAFLIVSGISAEVGPIIPPPGPSDVPPTVLAHLGFDPNDSWGWHGRAAGLKGA